MSTVKRLHRAGFNCWTHILPSILWKSAFLVTCRRSLPLCFCWPASKSQSSQKKLFMQILNLRVMPHHSSIVCYYCWYQICLFDEDITHKYHKILRGTAVLSGHDENIYCKADKFPLFMGIFWGNTAALSVTSIMNGVLNFVLRTSILSKIVKYIF